MKPHYKFVLIALCFFVLVFLVENLNGAFLLNDFKVYYEASAELLKGGNPYGQAYGLSSGFYKYSPATLLLFSPATAFSFETAKIIHFFLLTLISIASFLLCLKFVTLYLPGIKVKETLFLSLLLVFSAVHMSRELHLGNINMILILFTLAGTYFILLKKFLPAAVLFAVLFLLKPYFLILILPLIISWKIGLIARIVLVVVLFSLLPVSFFGFETTATLNTDWLESMSAHSAGLTSEHTFTSVIQNYTGLELSLNWQYLFIAIIGILYLSTRLNYLLKKRDYKDALLISDICVLLAIIPNLVITDSQHFLFSIPLISLILIHLFERPNWKLIGLFSILFFFYGMNSNDLLGNPLSDLFDEYSTIGVANLLLAGLFLYLRKTRNATSF